MSPKNPEQKSNKPLCVKCQKRKVNMYPIPVKNEKGEITKEIAYICEGCLKVWSLDTIIKQLDAGFNEIIKSLEELKAILNQRLPQPRASMQPVQVIDAKFEITPPPAPSEAQSKPFTEVKLGG